MLVPLNLLLLPGWEVTNYLTSQFSPTGIHRYPQRGGGVLTPSWPHHIAQTGHIIPSTVKQERGINPNLTTLSSPTGLYCSPMAGGVNPSLPAPLGCTISVMEHGRLTSSCHPLQIHRNMWSPSRAAQLTLTHSLTKKPWHPPQGQRCQPLPPPLSAP